MKQRAVIIGAGYGGMALANLLGKAGYEVHVYEKNAQAGGRIAAVKKDGFLFDIGPSWYLMPEVFEQYYQLFDMSATTRLDLVRFTPGYKVFFEKYSPIVLQGNVEKDKALFESIEPGAGARLESYVARSSLAYELAVKYFLYNNFLRIRDVFAWPVVQHAWRMVWLAFRQLDSYVSRYFHDIRLRQLLEYHMVFLGSSPFQAPAIYTLMSHLDYRSGVFYPKRGMLSLVDDMLLLGENYSIVYHYNSPCEAVLVERGEAVGIRLANGDVVKADIVAANADIHHVETTLLPQHYRSHSKNYWAKRQPGPGALLVSFGIKGELPGLLHHNLFFVDEWRANFDAIYEEKVIPKHASIYICNPTKTDARLAPKGHENIFVLMPLPAGVTLTDQQENALIEMIIDRLATVSGDDAIRTRIVSRHVFGPKEFGETYNAWAYNAFGGESHLLSQSVIFRTSNKSRKVNNLYYVGAGTVPGIGLPMCLISAQLTYKRIVGSNRPGPLSPGDIG